MLATEGIAKETSPVLEREVSSPPPHLPAAAGGKRENRKALKVFLILFVTDDI